LILIVAALAIFPIAYFVAAAIIPSTQPTPLSKFDDESLQKLSAAVADATRKLDLAQTAILDALSGDDAYKAAQQRVADAQAALDSAASDADRVEAAEKKMLAQTDLSRIIAARMKDDPNVCAAQARLADAARALHDAQEARRRANLELTHARGEENDIARPNAQAEENESPRTRATANECYRAVGPLLKRADGILVPAVRTAYLGWAEKTVLGELEENRQSVARDWLDQVNADSDLRDAMFGCVFPPDPSILQNYQHLCTAMGRDFIAKYRSLCIAVSVAKRIKGVESGRDFETIGKDYQPEFWTDESLQNPGSKEERDFIRAIADFMQSNHVAAIDLYQNADLQRQLAAFLAQRNVPSSLIAEVKLSVQFGERLKNAMVLLGQRPAARQPKPDTASWLKHVVFVYESSASSTPQGMSWPLFPLDRAPWPLLMPLAHPVPLSEANYIWEAYQGEHGPDRYHTYGPYRGDADAMPYELQPSKWFWDAWPDRIVHGGACVSISKGTVDLYSALDKPAMWAGQPGHANLASFQYVDGAWIAEVEQAFAGGPDVTFAQWYFNEDPGTELRYRDLYYWPGAEYPLGVALAMNVGLQSYVDTRLAANVFRTLPPAEKPTLGVKLLTHALQTNPFNPEIWYRLAMQTPGGVEGLGLAQAALNRDPGELVNEPGRISLANLHADPRLANVLNQYWQTLDEYMAQFSILSRAVPRNEPDMDRLYSFCRAIPGISSDEMTNYLGRFIANPAPTRLIGDAVKYDQGLADQAEDYGLLRMAERYWSGDGVARNPTTAQDLFAKAAAQGDMTASLALEKFSPYIPASAITVTPSSVYSPDQAAHHLTDGSGMLGILHDNNGSAATMWHTTANPLATSPANGLPRSPAWVRFDFSSPRNFDAIQIWNHNQRQLTDRGFRRTHVYGSSDGQTWFALTWPEMIELPRASGAPILEGITVLNSAASHPIKSVVIAADVAGGNYGSDCYGLSAVRFVRFEPAIPANVITVTPSSEYGPGQSARHLVDGSGLLGIAHDNDASANTMWQSAEHPALTPLGHGLPSSPAWVRFDFAWPQKFNSIQIWNHNQEELTDRGFRQTLIYGSSDGDTWFALTSPAIIELPRAGGLPDSEAFTIPNAAATRQIKSVIIAANPVTGNYGSTCYGLSAVRFIVNR
jgi:hypothetical protein